MLDKKKERNAKLQDQLKWKKIRMKKLKKMAKSQSRMVRMAQSMKKQKRIMKQVKVHKMKKIRREKENVAIKTSRKKKVPKFTSQKRVSSKCNIKPNKMARKLLMIKKLLKLLILHTLVKMRQSSNRMTTKVIIKMLKMVWIFYYASMRITIIMLARM